LVTSRSATAQQLRDLARLRRVRDRIDRKYAQRLPAPGGGGDRGDAAVRGQTGDPTGQEASSAAHPARASLTAMDLTMHTGFLPHEDPDASLAFWRDSLGFEVRNDIGYGWLRWITVGPADPDHHDVVFLHTLSLMLSL
jgi:hypothetical protein